MSQQHTWIISANRESLEHCARIGIFGLNNPGGLMKMVVGDLIVAYVTKEKTFGGIGRVTRAHYLDDEEVFPWGLYPDRIGIELHMVKPKLALNIYDVIDELSFIPQGAGWSLYFIRGLRQIPLKDYELITSKLKAHAK